VTEDAIEAVAAVLRSGWLGTGPVTKEFERNFAELCGVSSAAAVSSCTTGLFLAMKALGVSAGDEVITSSMTFVSTVNSILHLGATPVLVDISPLTGNLDLGALEAAITSKTKALVPVHYAGFPVEMDQLAEIADRRGLLVVEDCAHAVETQSKGRQAGSWGDAGVFSFYATKNIAVGEGGMVIARDQKLTSLVATLALHGLSKGAWNRFSEVAKRTYDVIEIGYKANFTDIQAAIGLSQLKELGVNFERRSQIWDYYNRELESLPLELPHLPESSGDLHARHLYVAKIPASLNRDEFVETLGHEHKLAFGVHYKSVPQFPIYRDLLNITEDMFPVSSDWGSRCISLSLSPGMSDLHVERVAESLKAEFR
jgi:dTDP-4-amino-4,6-dideoxygalactose transaminase